MLLKELAGYKSLASDRSIKEVIEELVAKGKIKVNTGLMAATIEPKDKPYVYRVWTRDRGYDIFLEYLEENPNNPHLVKVLSKVREIDVNFKDSNIKKINVVKLEKLSPLNNKEYDLLEKFFDQMHYTRSYSGDRPTILTKKFEQTVNSLASERLGNDANHDLFANNIMKRGETLVIFDPFVDANPHNTFVSTAGL